jgi:hypothetical protein
VRAVDYVYVFAAVIVSLAAIDVATQLRAIRRLLLKIVRRGGGIFGSSVEYPWPPIGRHGSIEPSQGRPPLTEETFDELEMGFCVWSFRDGKWHVELNNCRAGYDPCPPEQPGEYEGQCVRTHCGKPR